MSVGMGSWLVSAVRLNMQSFDDCPWGRFILVSMFGIVSFWFLHDDLHMLVLPVNWGSLMLGSSVFPCARAFDDALCRLFEDLLGGLKMGDDGLRRILGQL